MSVLEKADLEGVDAVSVDFTRWLLPVILVLLLYGQHHCCMASIVLLHGQYYIAAWPTVGALRVRLAQSNFKAAKLMHSTFDGADLMNANLER